MRSSKGPSANRPTVSTVQEVVERLTTGSLYEVEWQLEEQVGRPQVLRARAMKTTNQRKQVALTQSTIGRVRTTKDRPVRGFGPALIDPTDVHL